MRQIMQGAPVILQDMAAQVAEAVAVCYLAEARSGPNGKGMPYALCACRLQEGLKLHHNSPNSNISYSTIL